MKTDEISTRHFDTVEVRLVASAKSWIEGEAVRQLYATAKLEGTVAAVRVRVRTRKAPRRVGSAGVARAAQSISTVKPP